MLRCSSKRAFSSTTHTACLPFSDALISAGAIAESRLVRYTVVLSVTTFGSRAAAWTNASTLVANESYGCCTTMSRRRDLLEQLVVGSVRESALRVREPRLVLQVGPVERVQLRDVGEVEHAADRVHLFDRDAEALLEAPEHRLA